VVLIRLLSFTVSTDRSLGVEYFGDEKVRKAASDALKRFEKAHSYGSCHSPRKPLRMLGTRTGRTEGPRYLGMDRSALLNIRVSDSYLI